MQQNNPIIIACDFENKKALHSFLAPFEDEPLFLKIGMELYYKEGNALIEALKNKNYRLFLDLKLHDIPNTVAKALHSLLSLEVDLITLHAFGGSEMLKAAHLAAKNSQTKLLAVTVLTSLSDNSLKNELSICQTAKEQSIMLAKMANENGIAGIICSPHEAFEIRQEIGKNFIIVTPGIRREEDSTGDQMRIATPKWALSQGADFLVIGRPITASSNPLHTYHAIKRSFYE